MAQVSKIHNTGQRVDIGQLAAGIGGVSAVGVFVGANASYSFARGLSASLGFPAQIMTLRTSTEIFPGIVAQNAVAFVAVLVGGFFLFRQTQETATSSRRNVTGILAWVVVLELVGTIWDEHGSFYRWMLLISSFIAPALVGYCYRAMGEQDRRRPAVVGIMAFAVFSLNCTSLYVNGYSKGREIATKIEAGRTSFEEGLANVKLKDFPIVNVKSKESLQLCSQTGKEGESYVYTSSKECFIRLIAYDDADYYLLENGGGRFQVMAVRKDIVREMIFVQGL